MSVTIDKAIDVEEVNNIVALNEEYQSDDSTEDA